MILKLAMISIFELERTHHNTTIKYASHNGRSGTGRLWERHSSGMEGRIAVVVGEVEAWHGSKRSPRSISAILVILEVQVGALQVVRVMNLGYW